MSEVITMANSEIADGTFAERINYAQLIPAYMSYHGYLVKIFCHDLDKLSMYHDLP